MTQLSEELLAERNPKNVSPVLGDALDGLWDEIWKLFCDLPLWSELYDEHTTYESVKKGHLQVWAYSDALLRGIMVTRINVFPKAKVLDVVGLSGLAGIEFLQNLDDVCEHLARQQGCTYLSCAARDGMRRKLERKHRASFGYSVLIRPVGLLRSS